MEIIDVVALAESTNHAPVSVGNGEPFAITGTDVDIYRAKIIVLLMTWRTTAGYLENETIMNFGEARLREFN